MATHTRGECSRAVVTLEISSTTELASAQQRMRLLSISRVRIHRPEGASAGRGQHPIDDDNLRTLSFPIDVYPSEVQACRDDVGGGSPDTRPTSPILTRMLMALRRDKNRLVLREWKQGACWWNLNMNHNIQCLGGEGVENNGPLPILRGGSAHEMPDTPSSIIDTPQGGKDPRITLSMARAEVAGYRLARFAMDCVTNFDVTQDCVSVVQHNDGIRHQFKAQRAEVFIPQVLYFSHDNSSDDAPWALMSYFETGIDDDDGDNLRGSLDIQCVGIDVFSADASTEYDQTQQPPRRTKERVPCHHYPTTMVKIRHEFGFDEPHPRHGRVPADECLDYAAMILLDVIMPIQSSFFTLWAEQLDPSTCDKRVKNNIPFVGWNTRQSLDTAHPYQYQDMVAVYRHALHRLSAAKKAETNSNADARLSHLLHMLDKCVVALDREWDDHGGKPSPLPPVLCHMDLQPQNLAFSHSQCNNRICNGDKAQNNQQIHNHNASDCAVAAVMDWEEACYADPRFELLLVCRKVLANREQADVLWQLYSNSVQALGSQLSMQSGKSIRWDVGPLEPWLKLETVHSLCTLLLQAMDLLGGGRSPWETKPDLWGKIDRERLRLVQMGWLFCESEQGS